MQRYFPQTALADSDASFARNARSGFPKIFWRSFAAFVLYALIFDLLKWKLKRISH
jgi:hypothetical protein